MTKNPAIAAPIERYVSEKATRETRVQQRLREETDKLPQSRMLTTPDQVAFLSFMVRTMQARRILEVGTFTGYSALAMALALPEGGKLIACDVSKEWTNIAQRFWREAGVADRIELKLGPAQATLAAMIEQGQAGTFDFAFVDADKKAYDGYYETCLTLLKPGGVVAFDNMLWGGAVADAGDRDAETVALRDLNAKVIGDERVDACLLTVADGILMARKR